MIKQKWVFSIIRALEDRYEYLMDNDDTSVELKTLKEALDFFQNIDITQTKLEIK